LDDVVVESKTLSEVPPQGLESFLMAVLEQ
jgi:hypothetical protein